MDDLDARYRQLLSRQLTMNAETWRRLQAHGVTEATELRLDFVFDAPDESTARALAEELAAQTDYEVAVAADAVSVPKTWRVSGTTQPTTVSATILDQWVDWMVTAGLHAGCTFDGWGAEV